MSINSKIIIMSFILKYKYDWNKVMEAIKNQEDFADKKVEATTYLDKHDAFIITDDNFPESLRHVHNPPFMVEYKPVEGCESVDAKEVTRWLNSSQIVTVEEESFVSGIVSHYPDAVVCYRKNPTDRGFNIRRGDKEMYVDMCMVSHKFLPETGVVTERTLLSCVPISKILLVSKGEEEFVALSVPYTFSSSKTEILAIPGAAGSRCNKLIKNGAFLCDCWDDLEAFFIVKEDK